MSSSGQGREWVDLAVYQQKVKELQSTIRQRLHEHVDPTQFGQLVNQARSQFETTVRRAEPPSTPDNNDYVSEEEDNEPPRQRYHVSFAETPPQSPEPQRISFPVHSPDPETPPRPIPTELPERSPRPEQGDIGRYHTTMVHSLGLVLEHLYSCCHISPEQAEQRRLMKRISEEPSAENVMQQQKEIGYLNSRIPILLLINARDHLLLLSRQLRDDAGAPGLKAQLQTELHNVGTKLHQALLSWEKSHAEPFRVNQVRVLDVLLTSPAQPPPASPAQHRLEPRTAPRPQRTHTTHSAPDRPPTAPQHRARSAPRAARNGPGSSRTPGSQACWHRAKAYDVARRQQTASATKVSRRPKTTTSISAYQTPHARQRQQQQVRVASATRKPASGSSQPTRRKPLSSRTPAAQPAFSTRQAYSTPTNHPEHNSYSTPQQAAWRNPTNINSSGARQNRPRCRSTRVNFDRPASTFDQSAGDSERPGYMSPAEIESRIQQTLNRYGL